MPDRTVDLAALEAGLVALGWSVYKRSDFPEIMLRITVATRGINRWSQIHATRNSVRLADYVDSSVLDGTVQQMGVHILEPHWVAALAIIRKHVAPVPIFAPDQIAAAFRAGELGWYREHAPHIAVQCAAYDDQNERARAASLAGAAAVLDLLGVSA